MDNFQLPLLCTILSWTGLAYGQSGLFSPTYFPQFMFSQASPIANSYTHTNLLQNRKAMTYNTKPIPTQNMQGSHNALSMIPAQFPTPMMLQPSPNLQQMQGSQPQQRNAMMQIGSIPQMMRQQVGASPNMYSPYQRNQMRPTFPNPQMSYQMFRPQMQRQQIPNGPLAYLNQMKQMQMQQRQQQTPPSQNVNSNPVIAQMELKSKERMMATLIKYYKSHYGCVDAIKYTPQIMRFTVATQFSRGCGPTANSICSMATMHRNPRTLLRSKMLGQGRNAQITQLINSMDTFTALGQMGKSQNRWSSNPLTSMLGMPGMPTMPGMPGMPTMPGMSGMPGMPTMPGTPGMTAQGLMMGLEMGEVAEMRENLLPFQCQELGMGPAIKLGMCCPGPVELTSGVQMAINMGGA